MATMGKSPGVSLAVPTMESKRGSSSTRAAQRRKKGISRMRQPLLVPLTGDEMMAREFLVGLARQVEEEMAWKV